MAAERKQQGCTEAVCVGELRVDLKTKKVFRNGAAVKLTPHEFALLKVLVMNRGMVLTRAQILHAAWGYEYEGNSRTVDVHISRLRRKLGLEQALQTVYRRGYRLSEQDRDFRSSRTNKTKMPLLSVKKAGAFLQSG